MHLIRSRTKPQNLSEHFHERRTFIENILLPCLLFSALTGIFTGALIFSFNLISTHVIHLSSEIYHWVRENPIYFPVLLFQAHVAAACRLPWRICVAILRSAGSPTLYLCIFPQ